MTDTGRDAPAPLIARWHVGRIALQLAVVIVIVALVFIVPRITGETPVELPQDRQQELSEAQQEMERFGEDARWLADRNVLAAIIGCGMLWWGIVTVQRLRDRRPQLVIGTNGVYMRRWHLDTVPWEKIAQMSVSRPGLRSAIQSLLHNRRGPYVVVHFNDRPPVETDWPGPLATVQRAWRESDMREAVISPNNLDTGLSTIIAALRDHAAYWREHNPDKVKDLYD